MEPEVTNHVANHLQKVRNHLPPLYRGEGFFPTIGHHPCVENQDD